MPYPCDAHLDGLDRQAHPTPAESRVLRALADHGTIRAAAEHLLLSPYTVKAHLEHLRSRTGFHTTSQLIGWAARLGLLSESAERTERERGDRIRLISLYIHSQAYSNLKRVWQGTRNCDDLPT